MIKSMTAYGRAKSVSENGTVSVELKSVNNRFFDCTVKLPRAYLCLEEKIKAFIRENAISRGKVDVFINFDLRSAAHFISLDKELTEGYLKALYQLRDAFSLKDDITVMSVAKNTDLFTSATPETDTDAVWQLLLPPLTEACDAFSATATAEGEKTRADISDKMEQVTTYAKEAAKRSQSDIEGYRNKLEGRIRQMLADNRITIDEQRILTECAIVADRLAVDEELSRLQAHRSAFYEILKEGSPCGKKLDFLLQECNRETNTLGSKANDADIAKLVIGMKNELEKIREQVQNIE